MSILSKPVERMTDAELEEAVALGGAVGARARAEQIDRLDESISQDLRERQRQREKALKEKKRQEERKIDEAEQQIDAALRRMSDDDLSHLAAGPNQRDNGRWADLFLSLPGVVEHGVRKRQVARGAQRVLEQREGRSLKEVMESLGLSEQELRVLADFGRRDEPRWQQLAEQVREAAGVDATDKTIAEAAEELLAVGASAPAHAEQPTVEIGGQEVDALGALALVAVVVFAVLGGRS